MHLQVSGSKASAFIKDGMIYTRNLYSTDFDDLENAEIIGEKGKIQLNAPFWCPTKVTTPFADVYFEMPKGDMQTKFTNSTGFR